MREFEFIQWLRGQGRFDPDVVGVGPGDDCAVVRLGGEELLITTDQVLDGVHVLLIEHGPEAAGRKAAARALSDVAAMASLPLAMVATVAAPAGLSRADAEAIYHGLRSASDPFDCPLVGGDLAAWPEGAGRLGISVTIVVRPAGIEPVLRSGARAGDAICVTGAFGGAWRSRRHLDFAPRVREARALAAGGRLHAMIDVSDGLAADLRHVCAASGVAAEIDAAAVPCHDDAAADADARLAAALGDGEDYELLFTLAPGDADVLLRDPPPAAPVTRIGRIVAGAGAVLRHADGRREPLDAPGWEHET